MLVGRLFAVMLAAHQVDVISDCARPPPVAEAPGNAIVAGASHTCLLERGSLRCWGDNTTGAVGLPITASACNAWRSRYALTVPVLMDPSRTLLAYYPSGAFPAAIVVDNDRVGPGLESGGLGGGASAGDGLTHAERLGRGKGVEQQHAGLMAEHALLGRLAPHHTRRHEGHDRFQ